MSIRLENRDGEELEVDASDWSVLHYEVAKAAFLDDEKSALLRDGGVELEPKEARILSAFLADELLARLEPGQRLKADGTITSEPDDPALVRDRPEESYSLSYEVLKAVIEFFERTEGSVTIM